MRGLWGEGKGTLCMKLEMCLQGAAELRSDGGSVLISAGGLRGRNSLFQREDLRSGDGVSVDEGEELLEDAEEGPV